MSDLQRPPDTTRERSATSTSPPSGEDLAKRLDDVMLFDARRLGKRLAKVRRLHGHARGRELEKLAERVARAERRLAGRRSALPEIRYPPELPVSARVDDLAAAIREHQVVVVAGETGSGKSTQIPKVCLQLGRGIRGTIGHTQPRRIAARTLAERIAEETSTMVGASVGYAVRFGDHTSPRTLVKLMTDGILLAEIASDPDLLRYDTIILDEAHERSLNIDFLLGYLSRLLPRRPDLKLIITSATIDPEKFARHFGDAPIIEVSGRTYPVEIRYRPYQPDDVDDDEDGRDERGSGGYGDGYDGRARSGDQLTAITDAVDELFAAGGGSGAGSGGASGAGAGAGDILVFLSGEREITDTADALRAHLTRRGGLAAATDVLPLYGRLSMADQHKVFAPSGTRRIVLATNVAETSLTVPGIRYVIDPGTARISRYSPRTKVQRLPIEKISQASAGQRAGRCGRVADGICIRLYSQKDFEQRSEFTDPEIARTSLASVILQMAALGLGTIEGFPFVDPPETKLITDGLTVLSELGALEHRAGGDGGAGRADGGGGVRDSGAPGGDARSTGGGRGAGRVRLTDIGRKLAALPVDPRLARILVEGDERGCLAEALVIVAALAIRDVREYPIEERDKAVESHSRFEDSTSDFLAFLNLWHYLRRQGKELSGNKFRKMCHAEYLHFLRIREWQDLHAQLRRSVTELGMDADSSVASALTAAPQGAKAGAGAKADGGSKAGAGAKADGGSKAGAGAKAGAGGRDAKVGTRGSLAVEADRAAIHTALAAGLLSHLGARIERDRKDAKRDRVGQKRRGPRQYGGTRGTTFALWPGSTLAKTGAPLVIAAELVETSRLYARTVAAVDPVWIEQVGQHLIRRHYSDPHFSTTRNAIMATEKVMLLGVTLIDSRPVAYDKVDPAASRELMIRRGLVEDELTLPLPFLAANQAALDEVAESERRARRRDIALDDEALFALYDERIPAHVTTGKKLESWWRKESRHEPGLLTFSPDDFVAVGARLVDQVQYPDQLEASGTRIGLDYVFEPGAADDGISATVPLAALASIDPTSMPAQVPGMRRELALALMKSLPKQLRRALVPAPDYADAALARIDDSGALPERLAGELSLLGGISVAATDFDYSKVPEHLQMRFTVVDDRGATVAKGTDLTAIQRALQADTRRAVADVSSQLEQQGLTTFPREGLPRTTEGTVGSGSAAQSVTGYPAFVDDGDAVSIRVYASAEDQSRAMWRGTRRLVALALSRQIRALESAVRQLASPRGPSGPGTTQALTRTQVMRLTVAPHGSVAALVADAADAAIDALLQWAGGVVWTEKAFAETTRRISGALEKAVMEVLAATADVLTADAKADGAIEALRTSDGQRQGDALRYGDALRLGRAAPDAAALADELREEHDSWLHAGFIVEVGAAHLPDVTRYLTAITTRAERFRQHPERDRQRGVELGELRHTFEGRLASLRAERHGDADVVAVRRLIAEYRIAQFAQPMRTAMPVSAKRIRAAIDALPD